MRKMSRAALEQELARVQREASLSASALNDVINGRIESEATVTHGADTYTFRLSRCAGPSGGLLMVTFAYPGQNDITGVRYAEQALRSEAIIADWPAAYWPTLERLALRRAQIANEALAA